MNCKKILFVLLLTLGGLSNGLFAQIIIGEAFMGTNLTQVEGDEVSGFKKFGLNVGAGVLIPFKTNWAVSMEVAYNQKGAREGDQYHDTDSLGNVTTGAYKLRLNYVEVPLMVSYTDKDFITIAAGFSWGRLVGVKEWEHGKIVETTTLQSNTYSKNDFNYVVEARIRIAGPLKFAVRYQNSMVKIRTREFTDLSGATWTRDQFNKVLTFKLVYMFNESQSKRNTEANND